MQSPLHLKMTNGLELSIWCRSPGLHNKDFCCIQVNHNLNFDLLDGLLSEYHDKQILEFLKYGWPIERDMDIALEMSSINHKGATEFQEDIDLYIKREVELGATIGSFDAIPFRGPVAISPLSSRPKKGVGDRKVIMDCSRPIGSSLNDVISKDTYLGNRCDLRYPTIDKVARKIFDMSRTGELVYMFKEDLDRAFCQLYRCPKSVPMLGYRWRGQYYFDLVMMMGSRIAPYIYQRTTDMIVYLHAQAEHYAVNYVDDFLGIEYQTKIQQAHESFQRLLHSIGIQRSERKTVPPTQQLEFIGNLLDSQQLMLEVTRERKLEVLGELEKWRHKNTCTRRQLESIIGKLQFMSNCIRPGRLFVSRLLSEMKSMRCDLHYLVTDQMKKDLKWWYLFLPGFQGMSIMWLIDVVEVDAEIATDSCMVGAGGCSHDEFYRVKFPTHVLTEETKIAHLELWAVLLAVRIWGATMTGKVIRVKTNNEAVAHIINMGRSQDLLLQKLLRERTWWLAIFQFCIKSVHLMGKLNRKPDLLSRWHEGPHVREQFEQQEVIQCDKNM